MTEVLTLVLLVALARLAYLAGRIDGLKEAFSAMEEK